MSPKENKVNRFFSIVMVLALAGVFMMPVTTPAQTLPPHEQADALEAMEQVIQMTVTANDVFWTQLFLSWKYQEPYTGLDILWPSESIRSNCTSRKTGERQIYSGLDNNAYFCPADMQTVNGVNYVGVIYIPLQPMLEMFQGDMFDKGQIPPGNYAPVAIVSHEFAHSVVDELATQRGIGRPNNPWNELVADCLAGRFLRLFDLVGSLTQEQLNGIASAYTFMGDHSASDDDHGTFEERLAALGLGYNGGDGAEISCLNTYYPAIMQA